MRMNVYDFLNLINRDGYVAIEGLGILYKVHQVASFDYRNNVLKSPSDSLGFSEAIFEQENLKAYIAENYDISIENANAQVEAFVEDVISSILKKGSYILDQIGVISKNSTGIVFESQKNLYPGLPTLSVNPIIRDEEKKTDKIQQVIQDNSIPTYDYSRDDSSIFSWLKYIIPVILILSFILLWRCCSSFDDGGKDSVLAETNVSEVETTTKNDGKIKIIEDSMIHSESQAIPSEEITSQEVISDDFSDETSDQYNNLVDEEEISPNEESPTQYQECIIIAGTFGKAKNVLKMMDRIERLNLEVYDEVLPNGLTRVGFTFDGSQKDLPQYLREIRKILDKNAWYLVPQLTVH